jgi:hypothetical protein
MGAPYVTNRMMSHMRVITKGRGESRKRRAAEGDILQITAV